MSKQVLKCGTAIGALVREAESEQDDEDFTNKIEIAQKEARITLYWLSLLKDADFIRESAYESLKKDCEELTTLLV